MGSVLCVGIATLDYVYAVPALPREGAKYRASALEVVGGGIAANAAVAVARLGGTVGLLTRLGDDLVGDAIRAELAGEGVDLGLCRPQAGARSPVSAIMVDPAGERMIVSYADPALAPEPAWMPRTLPAGVGVVLGDTRWEEGTAHVFALAQAAGLPAILDADRRPTPRLLASATHIAFSETGLRELTGEADPRAGLLAVDAPGVWLAVTTGAGGVHVRQDDQVSHHPAVPVAAVDTLGAGDVWHGAFALALCEGQGPKAAIRFANAAAAIKCTRFGGRKGAPRRAEIEELLGENA